MSKKKWFILGGATAALSLVAVALVAFGLVVGFFLGRGTAGAHSELPHYHTAQTASTHPGYLRTTMTVGSEVYVNDYEEYSLRLLNYDPSPVIGLRDMGAKVCAISGQPSTAYIASDVGSEMPAYEVFRNSRQPPFDWRTVTFRGMQITRPDKGRTVLHSTDPALLAAVVQTLRDGAQVTPPTPVSCTLTNLSEIALYGDQLPGLAFIPSVYFDPTGPVYLSESISSSRNNTTVYARWVAADAKLAEWLKAPK